MKIFFFFAVVNVFITSIFVNCINFTPDADVTLPDVQLSGGHSGEPTPSPEVPGPTTSSASRHHRAHRSGGARDERYRSGTNQPNSYEIYYLLYSTDYFSHSLYSFV